MCIYKEEERKKELIDLTRPQCDQTRNQVDPPVEPDQIINLLDTSRVSGRNETQHETASTPDQPRITLIGTALRG